jgi:hypothetical protein
VRLCKRFIESTAQLPQDAEQVLKLAAQSMFDTFARTAMGTLVVDREHRIDCAERASYDLPFSPEYVFVGIGKGARLLAEGKLVAFPTETVYGLGADARDGRAVAAIFAASSLIFVRGVSSACLIKLYAGLPFSVIRYPPRLVGIDLSLNCRFNALISNPFLPTRLNGAIGTTKNRSPLIVTPSSKTLKNPGLTLT